MNLKFMVTLAFCLCTATLFAQNFCIVKGAVVDTASKIKLEGATIAVLNAKDSILRKFAYTANDGSFLISGLNPGKFLLLVTYRDYADYAAPFTLDAEHKVHDFGNLNMNLKARLLQEVLIKGDVTAIKIKGDTTEFNAKAYVIQPNDKVEDLLRQLPGIQVDQNGKITAQGFTISKVLVDGEEFFGDDPTLVTKNIRADMVSKVQLYDKKSDQATFTGIDDGKKTKTINIVLREDKKRGVFGKVDAGIGTNGYYQGQALYNKFNGNEKISAYGTIANTGKLGLGFLDNGRLGSGTIQIGDDGIIPLPSNGDLDASSGRYDGKGSPLARSAGAHYDNKWNEKASINTNYKIGSLAVTGINTTTTQQNLPTELINSNTTQHYNNYTFRQKLDATLQLKLDTSANLKIAVDGTTKNANAENDYLTTSERGDNTLLNSEGRALNTDGDQHIFNANILYTKKFKKPRRTFSWNIVESYNQTQTKDYLNSAIDFYSAAGLKDSTQSVNQYKTTNSTKSALSSNITYSEPLAKNFAVVFNYGLGINNSTDDRRSFNQSASGMYDIPDQVYSNNYKFNQLTNQLGAVFSYKNNNSLLNFGTKVSDIAFKQINEYTGTVYKRDFINWTPQISYQNSISKYKSISFSYNGNTTQPTIDQIQPVLTNTDPLFLTLGNPDLKPSFTNNFDVVFRGASPLSHFNFYISPSYSFTSNAIVYNAVTDAAGKTIIRYTNLAGKMPYNYNLFLNVGKSIKAIGLSMDIILNTDNNVSYSYINNELNMAENHTYSAGISLNKSKQNKYSLSASAAPNYTISKFSLQPQINNNAAGFTSSGRVTYYLPGKLQLAADISNSYKARTSAFNEQDITLLNATISKAFFKDNNLRLSLTGNDLLNQNLNINRRISGNTITQSTYSGIKRYFMFSITWDFTRFGTVPVKN